VNSIHSACAAAFARHRGKTGTLHLLQEEIFRLEKAIESVSMPVKAQKQCVSSSGVHY
jgi:T-lymphoma invasion and metastasis-inducing protein 1